MIKKIKHNIKNLLKKYLNIDLTILRTKVGQDFLDQRNILSDLKIDVKTIFDVGSNIGQTTRKYRKIFPKARIFGFEPFEPVYKEYISNINGDNLVYPENFALSDKNGDAKFFMNNCHYTNSLLPVTEEPADSSDNYNLLSIAKVKTKTLDDYCHEKGIKHINILKLDVQGGEKLVLDGAKEMLSEMNIDIIYSEVEFKSIYKDQPLFEDILKLLETYGYQFYKKYNIYNSDDGSLLSGDAIFININLKNAQKTLK
jgi:FkbM family methyltransferase